MERSGLMLSPSELGIAFMIGSVLHVVVQRLRRQAQGAPDVEPSDPDAGLGVSA